jgi:hypothetical protein
VSTNGSQNRDRGRFAPAIPECSCSSSGARLGLGLAGAEHCGSTGACDSVPLGLPILGSGGVLCKSHSSPLTPLGESGPGPIGTSRWPGHEMSVACQGR